MTRSPSELEAGEFRDLVCSGMVKYASLRSSLHLKSHGLSRSETVFKSSILKWEYITNLLKFARLITGCCHVPPFFTTLETKGASKMAPSEEDSSFLLPLERSLFGTEPGEKGFWTAEGVPAVLLRNPEWPVSPMAPI